ncbi:hypothetical protein AOLI_G00254320 [Acnodon oligacanthus]
MKDMEKEWKECWVERRGGPAHLRGRDDGQSEAPVRVWKGVTSAAVVRGLECSAEISGATVAPTRGPEFRAGLSAEFERCRAAAERVSGSGSEGDLRGVGSRRDAENRAGCRGE